MIKVAIVGAGKMGISHLAILGAHADVEVVGVCDTSKIVNDFLSKYCQFNCFTDIGKMMEETRPEAVVVAVPTKFHYTILTELLEYKVHVFAEKPFCLTSAQGERLVGLASKLGIVNQVGYHNKFIGTFREVKRIVNSGVLGNIYHFVAESYGPVVLRSKNGTWRSDPSEGGGCLMDYASHVIDLITDILAPVRKVHAAQLKSIYSKDVEDGVYSMLELNNNVSGILSVNWSDDTFRKMSTSITIIGTKGKIISDASELRVYLKEENVLPDYLKGWNVKYITELSEQVDFYLRGEEYSAQIDYFIRAILGKSPNSINNFKSAWHTDQAIEMIKQSAK